MSTINNKFRGLPRLDQDEAPAYQIKHLGAQIALHVIKYLEEMPLSDRDPAERMMVFKSLHGLAETTEWCLMEILDHLPEERSDNGGEE